MAEPVYEMNWDCPRCDTKGLLGLSHRFCPHCGGPQDPGKRYFPPEDQKVAVADHVFVGVDRVCPACDAPNGAKSDFCGTCGSPLDAAKAARLVAEGNSARERRFEGDAPKGPPPAPPKSGPPWAMIAIGMVALVALCCGVFMFWKESAGATIAGTHWKRSVTIEELKTVQDGAWKSEVPAAARAPVCKEKVRSKKEVPDGQECKTVNKDQGDGTFKQVQDCKPKTRSEDVYDTWCDFTIDKWVDAKTEVAEGDARDRTWPTVKVTGCGSLGCTREGAKKEELSVQLTIDGRTETCVVDEAVWSKAAVGQAWTVDVRKIGGGLDCASLRPAP